MPDRPPNIRHLAALVATVREGGVTRAARAVNLTQPALTQAIRRLEAELEVNLFERGPAGMTATEPAKFLAPRAEAALALIGSPRVTGTQLRAFLALARAGSYAAATQATGLSAASIHRAVADLSLALGQRLVDRRGRSVVLTSAGQRRARSFGLALAELRAGYSEVAAWQGKAGGRIVIGAMPLSRARWLPEAIAAYIPTHPDVDISVIEGSFSELSGPLREGEIDVVLGALREGDGADDLVEEPVFEDRPLIVVRAGHPLLSAPKPDGTTLAAYEWILPGRETPLRRYWEAMIRAAGAEPPRVRIECGSVLTVRQLLTAGDAVTLLSRDQVSVELDGGVLAVLSPPVPVRRSIGLIVRAGWRPTAAQHAFMTILRTSGPR